MSRGLLIGVLSATHFVDRRDACLETWVAQADARGVEVVFVVGDSTNGRVYRKGRILHCPCPDGYASLPQKTYWLCLWALSNRQFDRLFKCDDDTYVHINRLLGCDAGVDYMGHDIGGYASGGAGYLLSRRAAVDVVARLSRMNGPEDALVQRALDEAGYRLTADTRFWPWGERWPAKDNDLVTGHYCSPDRMRSVHAALKPGLEAPTAPRLGFPRVFHHVWLGGRPMSAQTKKCVDTWWKHHPQWQFKLWNESNLFPFHNQDQFIRAEHAVQRSTIARYEVLFREGGVCIDAEWKCFRNIEPLVVGCEAFAAEQDDECVGTAVLGARHGHPALAEVIAALPRWFDCQEPGASDTGLLTRIVKGREDVRVLDRRFFYPIHHSGTVWAGDDDAYAIRHRVCASS